MFDQGSGARRWLGAAIELPRQCPPSDTAYAVGAIIVGRDGCEQSRGYSRDEAPFVHAEESALAGMGPDLSCATIYTSMEPCSTKGSGPRTLTNPSIAAGPAPVV